MLERPTCPMFLVAVANLTARGAIARDGLWMWFEKFLMKKFHDSWPSTESIATKLPESIPSRRNLSPNPGVVFLTSGSGWLARLILIRQF